MLAGVDLDCKDTYIENNPESEFIHYNINKLPLDFLEKGYNNLKNNKKLILVGCSPCQYYSVIRSDKKNQKNQKSFTPISKI